ncbi:MAG: DUF2383 domain-containing protein [Candidatus Methylacidiphilales bacterium]|nr:DUF2383 domain-containing protein [Candidatus Methylacidiphilales bacterium]
MTSITKDLNDMKDCIDACNSLLRGELSAIETYSMAIHTYVGEPEAITLEKIRSEHIESANLLRQNVKAMGGEPDHNSGAWGAFAKTVQGTANMLGERTAIQVLLQGEEHGRNAYNAALENEDVMAECKDMISSILLPRIHHHIAALETLGVPATRQ